MAQGGLISSKAALLLGTGFCGSITILSTFSVDVVTAAEQGLYGRAIILIFTATNVLGISVSMVNVLFCTAQHNNLILVYYLPVVCYVLCLHQIISFVLVFTIFTSIQSDIYLKCVDIHRLHFGALKWAKNCALAGIHRLCEVSVCALGGIAFVVCV